VYNTQCSIQYVPSLMLLVEDVIALFENAPVKWGKMDEEEERIYHKLLECYQLSRKEVYL